MPFSYFPFIMNGPHKALLAISFLILAHLAGCSETRPVPADRFEGETMGTTYSVVINRSDGGPSLADLQDLVEDQLEKINASMSTYRPDSEISLFNQSTSTDWQPASHELVEVIQKAQEVSHLSSGAFDVTVAPMVNLWGFGPDGQPETIPEQQQIDQLLKHVGYQHLHCQREPPSIRKDTPLLQIDLSAIAKGYAVDQICDLLNRQGFQDILVEIGGELRAAGVRPGGTPWQAGIESPRPGERTVSRKLALANMALATSGDYRNFFVLGNRQYSHTIDPRTGWPVEYPVTSVSVLAESCMVADAWATALMASPPDVAYDKARELRIAVSWIIRSDRELTSRESPHFKQLQPAKNSGNMMWKVILASVVIFSLALAGMSIGVILGNRKLKGSCGGLANMKDDQGNPLCSMCETPPDDCPELSKQAAAPENPARMNT